MHELEFQIQWNFNGWNTDGSFITSVLNSFLVPWNKFDSCRFGMTLDDFLFNNEKWYIVEENRQDIPVMPPDLAL